MTIRFLRHRHSTQDDDDDDDLRGLGSEPRQFISEERILGKFRS
jgi:hypothetical protein